MVSSTKKKLGRPKAELVPLDLPFKDRPEDYPTLIKYLEANNKIKHTSYLQMMQARSLYMKNKSVARIAKELNIAPAIIDRWILLFDWEEERQNREFEAYKKISGLKEKYGKNLGERHDRIAGTIEQVVEKLLIDHSNGKADIAPSDLASLVRTIKSTQEIRRTARGVSPLPTEHKKTIEVNVGVPKSLEKLADMIGGLGEPIKHARLASPKTKSISVKVGEDIPTDAEYDE